MKNHKLSPFICGPRKHSVKTYHKLYNGNVTSLNTHTEDGEIVFKHNNLRINILKQKQLNVMNVFREGVPLLQVGACFATKLSMRRRRESKIKKNIPYSNPLRTHDASIMVTVFPVIRYAYFIHTHTSHSSICQCQSNGLLNTRK